MQLSPVFSATSYASMSPRRMSGANAYFGAAFPERLQANSDCVPTPSNIVETMIKRADIKPGMTVLEPSAGTGNIASKLKRIKNIRLSVIEFDEELREALQKDGFTVVGDDFLTHTGRYDRIVMNPPYSRNQGIKHVYHAYDQLKPGGRLVAVLPWYYFKNGNSHCKRFGQWLKTTPTRVNTERLHRRTFNNHESSANVDTHILTLSKPEKNKKKGQKPRFGQLPVPLESEATDILGTRIDQVA